ncbi:MAG: ArsC/Spx/MgsR family protein [Sphingopyxis sp.]
MKATIWHNPACGTSRKALAMLMDRADVELTVIPYLDAGYDRATLAALIADAGLTPQQALRVRGTEAAERGLPNASADDVLDAMASHAAYVERPFVRTEKGARLCRPQEKLIDIL